MGVVSFTLVIVFATAATGAGLYTGAGAIAGTYATAGADAAAAAAITEAGTLIVCDGPSGTAGALMIIGCELKATSFLVKNIPEVDGWNAEDPEDARIWLAS